MHDLSQNNTVTQIDETGHGSIGGQRDRDVSNDVYLCVATELFQDTIGNRQPILHSLRYRQETSPGVHE